MTPLQRKSEELRIAAAFENTVIGLHVNDVEIYNQDAMVTVHLVDWQAVLIRLAAFNAIRNIPEPASTPAECEKCATVNDKDARFMAGL